MSVSSNSATLFDGSMNRHYLADEAETIVRLLALTRTSAEMDQQVQDTAAALVEAVRRGHHEAGGLQAFLQHYDLSSDEGIVLMCLAEAVLRIPDSATIDALIADKLIVADWQRHLGESDSLFVNASTWALMLTGKVLRFDQVASGEPLDVLGKLLARLEEPVLRASLRAAIGIMAGEFVMGRTIEEALERTQSEPLIDYRFSYDMLGEAALTSRDADEYQRSYLQAIAEIGCAVAANEPEAARPSISVKLSALYPRFEMARKARAVASLSARVLELAVAARAAGVALTLDAEEADRLELTLLVFERTYRCANLKQWTGLGIAVQAYQKRAVDVLERLNALGGEGGRVIPVRLVKGAYWDTEIKRAQQLGIDDYPVFTLKRNTDVSYLACASFILSDCPSLYPQFATHNAHTVSYLYHRAGSRAYEFQRLHGMGEELYDTVVDAQGLDVPCRVYAPVGAHEDLLPYLVRRLLENGANTSFVNRIVQQDAKVAALIADPVALVERDRTVRRHPRIPLPGALFQAERTNSQGTNFADCNALAPLLTSIELTRDRDLLAVPFVDGRALAGRSRAVHNPARSADRIGEVHDADADAAVLALDTAAGAFADWTQTSATMRADVLERAADLFEIHRAELVALCVLEAGKTLRDSHDDVREAIDFLRYYAVQCRACFGDETVLRGSTGESSRLRMCGRGVFVCISPWNFPIAIYTGQIAAALAAGNTVIAKPAEQTSIAASRATEFLFEAGIPSSVLSFLPGDGATLGNVLLSDPRAAGVAFTGSTETGRIINRTLAERDAPLPALIAETGGINAMIVDSSALPEQVVRDVASSAFNGAGQRCSALRVLCLQDEIAPRVLELLTGYMDEWVTGDPALLESDMGPVIDARARDDLRSYIDAIANTGALLYRGRGPAVDLDGYFVSPAIIEIKTIGDVRREVFGPVLHVLRYGVADLPQLIDAINGLGYGLTLGVQSRIEKRVQSICDRARVGNVYVNRNMIGAVVGVQPFGGCGLSGTGPKAGGPHYLQRFATEQTVTVNTAAVGGNASLLSAEPVPTSGS